MATIFMAMFQPLLWALPIIFLGALLKSPAFKGWMGEWQVRQRVRRRLDPAIYREFHNVTIPSPLGGTSQIDHIYVSPFGVLVLETKNLSHWVWGRKGDETWTQQHYRYRKSFQNPLRQNHSHVKALEAFLGLPQAAFKPIVVSVGDCEFKNGIPDGVCTYETLIETIHALDERILSQDEVDRICGAIHARRLAPSWEVSREHVANLRRRHALPVSSPSRSPAQRSLAQDFVEATGQQLLRVAEDRIRHGARRHVSRGIQVGVGSVAMKTLVAIFLFLILLWGFNSAVEIATRPLQAKAAAALAAPQARPLPTARTVASAAPVTGQPQPASYHHSTPEEVAESQRRADEAMRVLAPNTPEIPLVLPAAPPQ